MILHHDRLPSLKETGNGHRLGNAILMGIMLMLVGVLVAFIYSITDDLWVSIIIVILPMVGFISPLASGRKG